MTTMGNKKACSAEHALMVTVKELQKNITIKFNRLAPVQKIVAPWSQVPDTQACSQF
jgi:hypothetical protein